MASFCPRGMLTFASALVIGAALIGAPRAAPAKDVAFDDATIADLESAMASGKLTSEKLVQMCLARRSEEHTSELQSH